MVTHISCLVCSWLITVFRFLCPFKKHLCCLPLLTIRLEQTCHVSQSLKQHKMVKDYKSISLNVTFLHSTMAMVTYSGCVVGKELSYLCVHHCPWNSGYNCLQRSLYQPRRDWKNKNKEQFQQRECQVGSDLVSGNFWKVKYSNLSWVRWLCALPAYWHGAVAENVQKRTNKAKRCTHSQTHDQLRQALKTQ